ncbi:MAG: FimV/HubP family polar landmark protein [Burkholderiaceae bacterium]
MRTTLAAALSLAFACSPGHADAAGLGRLTVQSGLGQPLQAQVEITALTREEATSLSARLATPEAFAEAGLEYNPALTGLRFQVQQRQGGSPVVAISSLRPINEPFVDLLIELNWSTGKFVREYTFLLDPPELQLGRAKPQELVAPITPPVSAGAPVTSDLRPTPAMPAVAAGATTASPAAATAAGGEPAAAQPAAARRLTPQPVASQPIASQPVASQPVAARPVPAAAQPAAPTPVPAAAQPAAPTLQAQAPVAQAPARNVAQRAPQAPATPTRHEVKGGETLAEIAESVRPGNVSLDQAIVAIYQRNPQAFFGSVHQMRAGAQLEIPTAAEMAAVTPSDARAEMVRGNQVFRAYRARLAERTRDASSSASAPATPAATAAVGQIGESSAPIVETRPSGDQLELSRDGPGAASGASPTSSTGSSSAASDAESAVARDIALRNAQERVSELERNVNDLQRLLELKNRQLAELSDSAATAGQGATPVASTRTPAPAASVATPAQPASPTGGSTAVESTPVAAAAQPPVPPSTAAPDGPMSSPTSTEPSATTSGGDATTAPMAAVGGGDPSLTERAGAALEQARRVVEPAAEQPPVKQVAAPSAEQSEGILDTVKNQVLGNPYVPAGVAVLLGLAGLFVWKRRRSGDQEGQIEDTLGGDDAFTSNSLFGTTGGQDVDTSNSLFGSVAAESESSVDVHSTEVDPIAEAEVYIAYGREAQAEEILKEALKRQPERQAIRLKLLEIYAGRKDATTYAHLAREMYDHSGGQNEEWPKVITMGLAIDPDNPLYTGDGNTLVGAAAMASAAQGVSNFSTGGYSATAARPSAGGARGDASLADADSVVDELEDALSQGRPTQTLEFTSASSDSLNADTLSRVEHDLGSLDFDLDTLGGEDASQSPATEAANIDDLDIPSLSLDLEDDSPTLSQPSVSAAKPTPTIASDDMSDLGLDIPSIDTLSGASASEAADVDLSSIGLDLAPAEEASPQVAAGDGARWQEMATKLDLASAYEEIGDREGARELLEEVVKGGDNAQQQKARAMLSKIS